MIAAPLLLHAFAGVTTPSPTPTPEFDPDRVSPGPLGFLAIFFVAVMVLLLMIDMVRRIRRTRYREEIVGRLEAERLEADLARGTAPEPDRRSTGTAAAETEGTEDPDAPLAPPRG